MLAMLLRKSIIIKAPYVFLQDNEKWSHNYPLVNQVEENRWDHHQIEIINPYQNVCRNQLLPQHSISTNQYVKAFPRSLLQKVSQAKPSQRLGQISYYVLRCVGYCHGEARSGHRSQKH